MKKRDGISGGLQREVMRWWLPEADRDRGLIAGASSRAKQEKLESDSTPPIAGDEREVGWSSTCEASEVCRWKVGTTTTSARTASLPGGTRHSTVRVVEISPSALLVPAC